MDQVAPMLAVAAEPFDSHDYSFEIKWDGVRALAAVESGAVWNLWGRNGASYTVCYPELCSLGQLPAGTVLDGELIQIADGKADFAGILRRHQLTVPRKIRWAAVRRPVTYVVFDLLQIAGRSLLREPLRQRRQELAHLLASAATERIVFSQGVVATGREYFRQVVELGHEGVMAKHLLAPYSPGKRSAAWRKIKPHEQSVCVIVGYQTAHGTIRGLRLAAHRAGELRYVGEVRTGLTEKVQGELRTRLVARTCTAPAVPNPPGAHWVRPEVYCLVHSFGSTNGGKLRFPCLRRLLDPAPHHTVDQDSQVS